MALTDKLTAIGDAIRSKTETTELIPLTKMPAKVNDVYEAGRKAEYDRLVDPTKIIKKTVSDSIIRVDDISEIPHKCTVSVEKDTTVTVCGKNLLSYPYSHTTKTSNGVTFTDNGDGTITVNGTSTGALQFDFKNGLRLAPGTYTMSGFADMSASKIVRIYVRDVDAATTVAVLGSGTDSVSFTIDKTIENAKVYFLATEVVTEITGTIKPQLEFSTYAGEYEPYRGVSRTITAGQTIEVDSICPTMTLFVSNEATITFGYHRSYGEQTAYDRFWDDYQEKGERTNYTGVFAGSGWDETTLNPKYSIHATAAYMMFAFCGYEGDLDDIFEKRGLSFTYSPDPNTYWNGYMFYQSKIKAVGTVNLSPITSDAKVSNMFNSDALLTIRNLIPPKANMTANCFGGGLTNLGIGGAITKSINLSRCSKLTIDSIQSVIDNLADLTGQTAQTLTLHSTVAAKLTDSQKAVIAAKNWTLVY